MDRFLALFGNETVEALPGYAQAGGQYCAINVGCRVKIRATLSDLASQWTGALAGFYVSQFGCGPLCERVLPYLGVPELFADAQPRTMNLLVGPARTGLPFHYHQRTWQALSFGRKAWFLVPPGRMSDDLARVVGPRIWPGDGFAAATRGVPPGQRPLRCVQYPGEIIWLPDNWWHATLNLDASVAYGQKPLLPEPGRLAQTPDVYAHHCSPPSSRHRQIYRGLSLSIFARRCSVPAGTPTGASRFWNVRRPPCAMLRRRRRP